MHLRSRTGCLTCKRCHKKCDETYPTCRHCLSLGFECRYAQFDNHTPSMLKPTTSLELLLPASSEYAPPPGPFHSSAIQSMPSLLSFQDQSRTPAAINTGNDPLAVSLGPRPSGQPFDLFLPVDHSWHASFQMSAGIAPDSSYLQADPQNLGPIATHSNDTVQRLELTFSPRSSPASASMPYPSPTSCPRPTLGTSPGRTTHMTAGQASLFQALLSLAQPGDALTSNSVHLSPDSRRSASPQTPIGSDDDDDPEGVGRNVFITPALDYNVQSNTLAFVLQSYSQWLARAMYDPLRIAHIAKEGIVEQISGSEPTRRRVIMSANAFNLLGSTLDLDEKVLSIISLLRAGVHQDFSNFKATHARDRETDMQEALQVLENLIEVISIHFYTSPLPTLLMLMQAAAPVFRRACPEPPEQLVNLPRIFSEPRMHRRCFAAIDVGLSITTNRPMLFRYDVTYTPEIYNLLAGSELSESYGLEWLHGIPDHFVMLFAWMNGLREDFYGRNVDPEFVKRIEEQARSAKVGQHLCTSAEADPVLRVRRLVVQECWRQVVYIFLYMNLCGASAEDPRVDKAFTTFMRLVRETRPARNPDAFLFIPMLVAGVAACSQHDRDTLCQRMLSVRECSVPGIVGHDGLRVLVDLWQRTSAEGRVAVWSDFRVSYERVVGI